MIFSAKNVTITYENKIAVDNVSFDVKEGEYLCIVGENGCGKSTLIKGILGLTKLKSGLIAFASHIQQTQIGYLPQQTQIQKDFPASVYEVVISGCLNGCGLRPFFLKREKIKAMSAIEKLGIVELQNKSYRNLSGGQQQRVLLARALCATEKLLVLDEPVTGLDPIITAEFYELVKKLNTEEKICVVMVSHDVKSALKYADEILHMGTKALFFGSTSDYIKNNISTGFMGGFYE